MPVPLNQLLQRLRKTHAETIRATIRSKISDGDYYCTLVDTGATVRASRGNIATDLTPGQLVLLGRPDSNGRSFNTGYLILGFPPGAAKGASNAPPANETVIRKGFSVSLIKPNPTILRAGGGPVAVDIYGSGLSEAPTYGDPGITNAAAPTIGPTHIALDVQASDVVAPGDYALIFGGVVLGSVFDLPNFFQVLEAILAYPNAVAHRTEISRTTAGTVLLFHITQPGIYRIAMCLLSKSIGVGFVQMGITFVGENGVTYTGATLIGANLAGNNWGSANATLIAGVGDVSIVLTFTSTGGTYDYSVVLDQLTADLT